MAISIRQLMAALASYRGKERGDNCGVIDSIPFYLERGSAHYLRIGSAKSDSCGVASDDSQPTVNLP